MSITQDKSKEKALYPFECSSCGRALIVYDYPQNVEKPLAWTLCSKCSGEDE